MLYARLNEKKASSISKQVTSNNKTFDTLCFTEMRRKKQNMSHFWCSKNEENPCHVLTFRKFDTIFQNPTQLVRWPESLETIRSRSPRAKRAETSMRKIFIGPESDHWQCLSVTDWLTNSLTHSLPFSKLYWCEPGMWRWQLKTCWSCYCCWSWWWETCRQQFGCRFGRLTLVIKLSFCSDFEDKVSRFVQDFANSRIWK